MHLQLMSCVYLIDASHGFDLLLLDLELGLPQKVGACHIFSLPIQSMQHSNHEQQQQEAFDFQGESKCGKQASTLTNLS